jgi:hypothetical protein
MPAELGTINSRFSQWIKNFAIYTYFLSTLFIVFFSVDAVQNWPSLWAQGAISLACIVPAIAVLFKVGPDLIGENKWPVEIKFVSIIIVLGFFNICFSENQFDSFKGMGLFLMSGIMVFCISYYIFNSKQTQKYFIYLCSFCFVVLLVFGSFEYIHDAGNRIDIHGLLINNRYIYGPGKIILLFSSNPIPAGSLLILLSIGPLVMVAKAENRGEIYFWASCLLAGVVMIFLIAQKGPILALVVMAFVGALIYRKGTWILIVVVLALSSLGYQFRDKIPLFYKNQTIKIESVLVRIEFYYVALDVIREKPIFGLGFNSSLSRFIPFDYVPKIYPKNGRKSFFSITRGIDVFDNIFLSLVGEMGGLFALAYISFLAYVLKNISLVRSENANVRAHTSLLLMVITGFLLHSLTFDSLKYPHLNWIFHSLLGLIAHSQVFGKTKND